MKNKILVVDDNPDILTVLKANLELHGYGVVTAASCKEASSGIEEDPPDLVVLDRMLPDGDGVDLCNKWRAEDRSLPVILLTARDSVSDRVLGLESGADDYVIKPFEPLELIARIRACLRRLRPEGRERLSHGGITLDKVTMSVTVDDRPVELTPKEFQLLCLFMEHPGEAISRERIKESLWKDSKIYSWSRVIDVHIQHLRQKLEPDPSNPRLIRTLVGVGYRFEA